MRRSAIALAVSIILLMAASVPASAMSWFEFRINPGTGSLTGAVADLPYNWTSTMAGATVFLQPPSLKFGLRLNLDTGSISNLTSPSLIQPPIVDRGRWRYYDISLGLPFKIGSGTVTLFGGYGNHDFELDEAGGGLDLLRYQTSGLVFGADIWYPIGDKWFVSASGTFGSNNSLTFTDTFFTPLNSTGKANTHVYSAAVGYRLPGGMSKVELGWRSGGFDVTSIDAGGFAALDGNQGHWEGVYLGLVIHK